MSERINNVAVGEEARAANFAGSNTTTGASRLGFVFGAPYLIEKYPYMLALDNGEWHGPTCFPCNCNSCISSQVVE